MLDLTLNGIRHSLLSLHTTAYGRGGVSAEIFW